MQTTRLRNFSRLVSHEIRQPLGVLQVLTRMLPSTNDQPEAARLIGTLDVRTVCPTHGLVITDVARTKPQRFVHISADHTVPYPCIRICDNGIGIPPSKRDTIFEQFVRVHAHRDDELGAQGMGLGLSIVRECMESMEGSVAVESVEGTGTTFVLCWPGTGLR